MWFNNVLCKLVKTLFKKCVYQLVQNIVQVFTSNCIHCHWKVEEGRRQEGISYIKIICVSVFSEMGQTDSNESRLILYFKWDEIHTNGSNSKFPMQDPENLWVGVTRGRIIHLHYILGLFGNTSLKYMHTLDFISVYTLQLGTYLGIGSR